MVISLNRSLDLTQVFLALIVLIVAIGFILEQGIGFLAIIGGVLILGVVLLFSRNLGKRLEIALRTSGLVLLGVAAGYIISTHPFSWKFVFILALIALYLVRFLEDIIPSIENVQKSRY